MDENEILENIKDDVEKIKDNGYTLESGLTSISNNVAHIDDALSRSGNIYEILDKINKSSDNIVGKIKTPRNTISGNKRGGVSKNEITQINNVLGTISGYSKNIEENTRIIQNDVRLLLGQVTSLAGFLTNGKTSGGKNIGGGNSQKEEEDKTTKEYWKEQKEREKRERKAKRQAENGPAGVLAKGLTYLSKGTTAVAEGIKSGQTINAVSSLLKQAGPWGMAAGTAMDAMKALFDLYAKQDKMASAYAREIGGGRRGKNEFLLRTNDFLDRYANPTNGYNQELVASAMTEYSKSIGRSIMGATDKTIKSLVDLKRFNIGADIINNFETFGKSIQQTDGYFTSLYQRVSKRGLSFRNVSDAVNRNLKMAQTHNFSSGLKSLERMAERSTQLKFNMQEAANFADKVSTFEGAISTGAALSVLGGPFTRYSNPMQLMYEGLNSVDELQERMIKMVGDMAEYNKETQSFRINPVNQLKLIRAAEAMGVSREEMTNIAFNEARYKKIEEEARGNKNLDLNKDVLEYIKNLAEFSNGKATIRVNGEERDVSSLKNSDTSWLKMESEKKAQRDAAGMGDIFEQTMGIGDKLDNILNYLTTKLGTWVARIAGVGWDDKSQKAYWKENKQELIEKYGSRASAKYAIRNGQEDENVDKRFSVDGEKGSAAVNREYYNATRTSRKDINEADKRRKNLLKKIGSQSSYRDAQAYYNERHENKGIERANGIIAGPSHIHGGIPAWHQGKFINIEGGEALINARAVQAYGRDFIEAVNSLNVPKLKNIIPNNGLSIKNIAENNLKPLNVAPTIGGGGNSSIPSKISFGDFNVNVGGRIQLESNGSVRDFDLSRLSEPQLDKLTQLIYKKVYDEIRFREMKGFSKETSIFRGA